MIVTIGFDLSKELIKDLNVHNLTVRQYDNYLFSEFGLEAIDVADVEYIVTDVSKFSMFMLKYPEFIISIE